MARDGYDRQERCYHLDAFLAVGSLDVAAGVAGEAPTTRPALSPEEADTVVVPAHEAGARETFLGENRWYAVRIHGAMRPRIKYIALYQVAPVSAITHVAPVRSIEPWKESDRVVVNFAEPAEPISPIRWVRGGHVKTFQNLRYATYSRVTAAEQR